MLLGCPPVVAQCLLTWGFTGSSAAVTLRNALLTRVLAGRRLRARQRHRRLQHLRQVRQGAGGRPDRGCGRASHREMYAVARKGQGERARCAPGVTASCFAAARSRMGVRTGRRMRVSEGHMLGPWQAQPRFWVANASAPMPNAPLPGALPTRTSASRTPLACCPWPTRGPTPTGASEWCMCISAKGCMLQQAVCIGTEAAGVLSTANAGRNTNGSQWVGQVGWVTGGGLGALFYM